MDLGTRIRALRTARQLSQETVAARLHVSRQAVAKWENGTSMPSTANLLALCALFDVPPEQLTAPAVPPRRRIVLPYALFAAALLLLAAGIVLYSLQPRLPDGVIGYADGPTALYVTGLSPLPLLLGGAAAVLAAIGGVLLWRAQRQKGGRR